MGPTSPFDLRFRQRRAVSATLLVAAVFLFLGASFFRTQIIRNHDFVLRAEDNRMRVVPVPAPRGAVFDRNGEIIAETVTSYALYLGPTTPDSLTEALALLREPLGMGDADVDALMRLGSERSSDPVLVARALDFDQVSWIEEHRTDLPQLTLDPLPRRHYPAGEAIAHLIGYVAEISRTELDDSLNWPGYRMGQLIGRSGIEREYEPVLGGRPGERFLEVDARGRVVGAIAPRAAVPPVPGTSIHLSLDLELQRFIHSIFPKDLNGAVVALEPSTGEVLALYSYPSYDPNQLTGGVAGDFWRDLNSNPRRPLLNRSTAGIYPPGSTWKLATAIVGLEQDVISPSSRMTYGCAGGLSYAGRYARCWKAEGHGSLDLAGAIANSCNVYFYQLGIRLGLTQLMREGTRLGFARRTGIDLPTEHAGIFPADVDSYRERFGWSPTPSEVMSLAIGQGPNSQTPLRMAQFFAALAGDGTAPSPRLFAPTPTAGIAPLPETDLKVKGETLEALRRGLAMVMEPGGTAYMSSLERWKMFGKTGTSQNTEDPTRPHAWFTGFAGPQDGDPEIAFSVIIERGESGSAAAAPIAAKLADFYLNRKYGLPTLHLQTLRERLTGIPLVSNEPT